MGDGRLRLVELDPRFLKVETERTYLTVDSIDEADGVFFLCPKCFQANGGRRGTHAVICWRPRVPQTVHPIPGRWELVGTGFDDLSLVAGSSSVLLQGPGCAAHFFVRDGGIDMA